MKKLRITKTLFLIAAFGLLSGCQQPSSAISTTLEKANPFVFEQGEHDFGVIKQSGGIVSHDFTFRYEGKDSITVANVVGSCLCTEGEISGNTFNPGDEGILTVKFNPNLHAEPKGKFFKTVAIITEPRLPELPEVKVWTEIDLDLGEEFFELKAPHSNESDHHEERLDEISHSGEVPELITSETHDFYLEAKEVSALLNDEMEYAYWTFDGTVPGPMLRVKEGDRVNLHLSNNAKSKNPHSIDLHAVNGPGGGSVATEVYPGENKTFSFIASHPGLYVYHCATKEVAQHMANGMYGMILVEPKKGYGKVDREFYIMQGEFYPILGYGEVGSTRLSGEKLHAESPEYIVFNGRQNALMEEKALKANVGDKVRLFVGNGGVSKVSNFHVIGEIFDKVYVEGGSLVNKNVQSTVIPAGGSTIVEFTIDKPGKYLLVDHALARLNKGAVAELIAS